jgi:hypothetical protein
LSNNGKPLVTLRNWIYVSRRRHRNDRWDKWRDHCVGHLWRQMFEAQSFGLDEDCAVSYSILFLKFI